MALITAKQVKAVIDTGIEDLSPFITTAEAVVNDRIGGKLSSVLLAQIAIYLAAHYITVREKQIKYKKFGQASASYDGETGMGLRSSIHGQQAIALDSTKALMRMDADTAELESL